MKYTLAIFDLDGTLLNTSEGIFATANATITKLGYEPVSDEAQLAKFIGPPISRCFTIVYDLDPALIDEAIEIYRREYDRSGRYLARSYEGIDQALTSLRSYGIRLAVGTLKYERLARQMLEHFALAHHFETIKGSDDSSSLTKADIVTAVLDELGVEAENAVLIGDTVHDEEGARDSGVDFIAVDYGFGFPKGQSKDEGMVAIARSAQEVVNALVQPCSK